MEIGIAIKFEINSSDAWFTSRWIGPVTDEEILAQYLAFYRGGEWAPTMREFADLSDADMSRVTAQGLAALAKTLGDFFQEANVSATRTAVFSQNDLPFGLARVYEAYAEESPESVQVFRDREDALRWLAD